jgi:nascent polypeptide-associated complex subunit beta
MNNDEIEQNRQKMKEKIGNARTGGKGSARRKHKVITKVQINDDKKLKSVIKKYGA